MADDRVALIKRVKEANDIVEVVGSYLALRPAGQTFKGLCPFHDDSHPSFDVDPRRQRYRCWSCNKVGDVISFVQEHERVSFPEAVELLARRAGIPLEKRGASPHDTGRALMLDTVRWAAERFQKCLLDDPLAENARQYLGERRLTGETVRKFGVGFAPATGDWLLRQAAASRISVELLEKVGLVARRQEGGGYYDRFRDRVLFPIRDARGSTIGFGGRILPSSPYATRAPKYYNTAGTPLFSKGEWLYGLDMARQAATTAGYFAVVEGYTDVLMAHQYGMGQLVSPMGTALTARQVQLLRRFVPRVVLVFDADAGGDTGVDRALEIFVSQEVDLQIATLPEGMDPCDLLVAQGPEAFRAVLEGAVDALDFKLAQVLQREASAGVEGRRRAADAVLGIIALAPEMPGQSGAMKRELTVTRIAQRLGLKEERLWARLEELRPAHPRATPSEAPRAEGAEKQEARPAPGERELLQMLLAEPGLIPLASAEVAPEHLQHPGLRRILQELYQLHASGEVTDMDRLRLQLVDNPPLAHAAMDLQDVGLKMPYRQERLRLLLEEFRKRRLLPIIQELHGQLQTATDHDQALKLLKRLQEPNEEPGT